MKHTDTITGESKLGVFFGTIRAYGSYSVVQWQHQFASFRIRTSQLPIKDTEPHTTPFFNRRDIYPPKSKSHLVSPGGALEFPCSPVAVRSNF